MVNKGKSKEKEMGLSSSSARYLFLTDRKHDLEYRAMNLTEKRRELSMDMNKITKDYQNALKVRKLKLSNNSGASYTDLSYKTLMKPSLFNNYQPYFISDQKGRIVLNTDYAKYAKQLGIPQLGGVDFDTLQGKDAVLSKLTGLDESRITNFYQAETNVKNLQNEAFFYEGVYNYWQEQASVTYMSGDNFLESLLETAQSHYTGSNTNALLSSCLNESWLDTAVGDMTAVEGHWNAKNVSEVKLIARIFAHIIDANKERFSETEYYSIMQRIASITLDPCYDGCENIDGNEVQKKDKYDGYVLYYGYGYGQTTTTSSTSYGELLLNIIKDAFNGSGYYYRGVNKQENNDWMEQKRYNGNTNYSWVSLKNSNSSNPNYSYNLMEGDNYALRGENWRNTYLKAEAAKGKYDEKYKAFQNALSKKNAMLNADEESTLEFYENILRAVCENGWVENNQVNDPEYLDNMLQNNIYMMTTQTFKEGLIEYSDFADAGYAAASKKEGANGYIAPGADASALIASRRAEIEKMYQNGDYTPDTYSYTTRMAGDFDKLFTMSDTDIQAEAEAAYVNAKAIVKTKEQTIDIQLEKIKTEQSAITQMMQSIKQSISSNTEKMNVFTA